MWGHERRELGRVMVGAHKQITLVLVSRVACRRLCGRSQALKIEFVRIPLPVYLRHDIFVVVVSAQRIIVIKCVDKIPKSLIRTIN